MTRPSVPAPSVPADAHLDAALALVALLAPQFRSRTVLAVGPGAARLTEPLARIGARRVRTVERLEELDGFPGPSERPHVDGLLLLGASADDVTAPVERFRQGIGRKGLVALLPPAETRHDSESRALAERALGALFPAVRAFGARPFSALAIAESGAPVHAVSLDTTLGDDAPFSEWFVLAGESLPKLDGATIVELPAAAPIAPAASSAPLAAGPSDDETAAEIVRLETELRMRAREAADTQAKLAEYERTVRELVFTVENTAARPDAERIAQLESEARELRSLHVSMADELSTLLAERDALRALRAQPAAVAEAPTAPAAEDGDDGIARDEILEVLRSREAVAQAAAISARERVTELERTIAAMRAEVERATTAEQEHRAQLSEAVYARDEARTDLSRQYAVITALQTRVEAAEGLADLGRAADTLKAELSGVRFRLADAEAALRARAERVEPVVAPVAAPPSPSPGSEQLLADLAETAERLARTEEALRRAEEIIEARQTAPAIDDPFRAELAARTQERDALVFQLAARDREVARLEEKLVEAASAPTPSGSQQKEALTAVRQSVAQLIADGRGALIAHDLVLLLRRIDGALA